MMPRYCAGCSLALTLVMAGTALLAQPYPNRPLRMVVPVSAGGSYDTIGRLLARQLTEKLGQQVLVDNRAGNAGNIGSALVAKATPDGYTMLFAGTTFAINVSLYQSALPFDALRDFAPVSLIAKTSQVLTAHPSLPARTLSELIVLARRYPGRLTYGSGGNGTPNHLVGELLKTAAHIDLLHVPFKGGSAPVVAVLAGQIDLFISAPTSVLQHVRTHRLRALAVSTATRSPVLPDTPTMSESGMPGFDAASWYCLLVPAATPANVGGILRSALIDALQSRELNQRFSAEGAVMQSSTGDELTAFLRAQIAQWGKAVKISGAKAD
jgi:tripartite-type tricarboxylate transporter receptor subunit TctC